jgi:uncharacterized protein YutE (UPF0331/DUF86 family)
MERCRARIAEIRSPARQPHLLPVDVEDLLAVNLLIDEGLAGRLRRMVGFRNIAVHQYRTLDLAIMLAIAQKHLGDFHIFAARVLDHLGLK